MRKKRNESSTIIVILSCLLIGSFGSAFLLYKRKQDAINSVKSKLLYGDDDSTNNELKKGDIVMHITYGKGVIIDIDEKFITIAFNHKIGTRKFLKNYKGIRKVN